MAERTNGGEAGESRHGDDVGWTGQFVETNGIRMYAVQGGRGRPVVLLHGLGWDHTLWTDTLARLTRETRGDMVAPTSRGGRTPCRR